MKKVCVFTGSRANYSSTRAIMKAIQANPELQLQTVIGAAAILDRYGNIESMMKSDGFTIDAKFHMIIEGETPTTMAKSTGLGIIDISMIFENLSPDMVVIVGDRFDVMAPTIAAAYMNIPIAHTMGGEVSGTIDESIRHAITKFAHLHFTANEDARQRIIKMGEREDRVFNVGCPRMDYVKELIEQHRSGQNRLTSEHLFANFKGVGPAFDIAKDPFLIVSQHPVTTEYGKNREHIEQTLAALQELKMPTIMIWPNADAGSDEISKGIRTFREKYKPDWLHLFINLPIEIYVKLMDVCACIIGNSSSSIREGAFIGVPAVNIGSRQNMRLKGKNVIDVDYHYQEIVDAVRKQLRLGKHPMDMVYGNGTSGIQIAQMIATTAVDIQKVIQY
jgi:UDP-hydrolysing UDP-N-acetyl-D-glucosamine 2-epimerase